MGKYFGTDGFRGEANVGLTVEHAYKVGRFIGWYYGKNYEGSEERAKVVIGKDTRLSSYMFEYALSAGITASGADACLMHVTTTPSVAYIAKIDEFIAKNRGKHTSFEDTAALHVYSGTINRYELQKTMSTYEDEIHIIRFGDIAIATNPYELFLDYGNRIRARSLAKQTFLVQLSCGSRAYLPTEKAERGSHYSAYVSSGMTGHEGGDILVATTVDHINKMFKN